jgi:uncharacterized protein YecE (DUF72 family)
MALFVGTSGWAYKEWRPGFYPAGLPQSRWLEHYAHALTACEINATFYRRQEPSTFEKWAAAAPPSFRFATKAHRAITHARILAPTEERRVMIDNYFKSISALGTVRGPVLLQFPASRQRDDESFRGLLETLPGDVQFAFEFGHESWKDDDIRAELAERGGTECFTDWTGDAPEALPPGPLAYIRMRVDRYSVEQRARWRDLLRREATGRDVYAFSKHEGIAPENSQGGIGLARWLTEHAEE